MLLHTTLPNECFCITYQSPLGEIELQSNGKELTGLWFSDQQQKPTFHINTQPIWPTKGQKELLPVFEETVCWLDKYFDGKEPDCLPPLSLTGTDFSKEVWTLLMHIPYGQVISYKQLAHTIDCRHGKSGMSAQAIGRAVGRNPISIVIPCHRVVGSNGSLTGYAGGIERKRWLLEREGIECNKLNKIASKDMLFHGERTSFEYEKQQ